MTDPLLQEKFTDTMARFIGMSAVRLPDDVTDKLRGLREKETSPVQKVIYDSYFDNLQKAAALNRPSCQDTGLLHFYISAGTEFKHLGMIESSLREAVRRATAVTPLRPNAVNFFEEKNTGDNTGERMPWIHWDLVPGSDKLEILTYFAGAGCSLPGCAKVFKPSDGYEAVVKYVFDTVSGPGLNACPPLLVGVGLGNNVENAAVLSKKAYLRPLGTHHPDPRGAKLEEDLLKGLNSLGVGAQGLQGNGLVMEVHVESCARHTATIAAAVNVSCYMHRRSVIVFSNDLSYEIPSHRGIEL